MNHQLEVSETTLNSTRAALLTEKLKEFVHLLQLIDIDKAHTPEFYTDIKIVFKESKQSSLNSIIITLSGHREQQKQPDV